MPVDAEEVAKVAKRRSRIAYVQMEVDKIPVRIDYLTELYARFIEELDVLLNEEDQREDRSAPVVSAMPVPAACEEETAAPMKKVALALAPEAVRDAAVRLGVFTEGELAGVLGVAKKQVKSLVAGLIERRQLRSTGQRFHGQAMYEYLPPAEAGSHFEAQRRSREQQERERRESERHDRHGGSVHGGIAGTGSPMLDRLAKPVRLVIRRAERDGWTLIERGDGHFALERDGYAPLRLSHTPRSATGEAASLESRLRNPKPLEDRAAV